MYFAIIRWLRNRTTIVSSSDLSTPDFIQPSLIFHGRQDPVVPCEFSEQFAASHPNARLHVFDDGHELNASVDAMWTLTAQFLQIKGQ